jgi:hypothetical protein
MYWLLCPNNVYSRMLIMCLADLFRLTMDLYRSLANVSAAVWFRVCYALHKILVRYLEKAERDCM